jgi:hypothetical protein
LWTVGGAATGSSSSVRLKVSDIRSMLGVATGKLGKGGFGTPIGTETMLRRALGEEEA